MTNKTIKINYRYIRYTEGDNFLDFDVEKQISGESIIYFPNEENWDTMVNDWAKGRRNEIIEYIKNEIEFIYSKSDYVFKYF